MDFAHDSVGTCSALADINRTWFIPDYVLDAEKDTLISKNASVQLGQHAFADKAAHKYPICSKADTWLSVAYCHINNDERPHVKELLKEACVLWGLGKNDFKLKPQEQKEASADIKIHYRIGDDIKATVTVTPTQENLEKIASDIIDHPEKYPYLMRLDVSKQLLNTGVFKGEEKETLEKVACRQLASLSDVKRVIRTRFAAYRDELAEDCGVHIDDMFKEAEKHAVGEYMTGDGLQKIATVLDCLDRFASLYTRFPETKAPEFSWNGVGAHELVHAKEAFVKLPNGAVVAKQTIIDNSARVAQFLKDACAIGITANGDVVSAVTSISPVEADILVDDLKV